MDLHNEDWYPIVGYDNYYEITKTGRVRSKTRVVQHGSGQRTCYSKNIKVRKNNYGYLEIRLSKDGVTRTHLLHRLLAQTFIPNPLNKKEVNHKNGFKTDNRLPNLEWCSHEENIQHAYKAGLINKRPRPVVSASKIWKDEKEVSEAYALPIEILRYHILHGKSPKLFFYLYP
jgi:hypothetical protein